MAKILIIDDDPDIRELFVDFFSDSNDKVEVACDGQKALEKLKSFVPDIILLDISMPVMTGGKFIKNLERAAVAEERLRGIPFIVLTGENPASNPDYEVLKGNRNCKGFFRKGLPLATVANQIIMVIAHSGKS